MEIGKILGATVIATAGSDEKLELAKPFCIIAMAISPGATKVGKFTPSTSRPPRPSATEKMTRKSSVVIAGAQIVCVWTLRNRRTSFI